MSEVQVRPWEQGWEPPPPPPEGQPSRHWYPGMPSPNPKGRPRGITDRKAKLAQRMLEDADGIVDAIVAKALEGDSGAAALILSRVLPALKAQAEKVEFDFDPAAPVSSQVEMVLAAISGGAVAPDVGRQIIEAIGALSNVRATELLEARIAALEDGSHQSANPQPVTKIGDADRPMQIETIGRP